VTPVARVLRELGVPFVFLTAYASLSMLPREFQTERIFRKPVSVNRLVKEISSLVGTIA
jgi:two-component SAPR family response regulator